jgi:hypothetical protein
MNYIKQEDLHLFFDPALPIQDLKKYRPTDSMTRLPKERLDRAMKVLSTVTARGMLNVATPTPNRVDEIMLMKRPDSGGAVFYVTITGDHVRGPLDLVSMPYALVFAIDAYSSTPVVYRTEDDQGWRLGRIRSINRDSGGGTHTIHVEPTFSGKTETDFTVDSIRLETTKGEVASEAYIVDVPEYFLPKPGDSDELAELKMEYLRKFHDYRYSALVIFAAGTRREWLTNLKQLREDYDVKLGDPRFVVSGTASILVPTREAEYRPVSSLPDSSPAKKFTNGTNFRQAGYLSAEHSVDMESEDGNPIASGSVLATVRNELGAGVALSGFTHQGTSVLGLNPVSL